MKRLQYPLCLTATICTLFAGYNIHFVCWLQYPLCLLVTISTLFATISTLFDGYNIHFVWRLQYPLCLTATISTLFAGYNIHFVWRLQYPLCLTATISTLFDGYNIHFVWRLQYPLCLLVVSWYSYEWTYWEAFVLLTSRWKIKHVYIFRLNEITSFFFCWKGNIIYFSYIYMFMFICDLEWQFWVCVYMWSRVAILSLHTFLLER